MKTLLFSTKPHDRRYFEAANQGLDLSIDYLDARLVESTASLCAGYDIVCVFVNDQLTKAVIGQIASLGVKHIALRCAGFNNVDLAAAEQAGITVSRVPAYSPEAVAEHTIALMMVLNRKIHKAYNRVRENNFILEGLTGFNFHGKIVGVVGTGKIGRCVINILRGLGCHVRCYDPHPDTSLEELPDVHYVPLNKLIEESDIVTLHCPLTEESHHLINHSTIDKMKHNVMLINTSRGGLIDTQAIINGLKSHKIGYLGLDVYEMESELFFQDKSSDIMQDDVFARLLSFPNVVITGHQGFYTDEALRQIASTTINNLMLVNQGNTDTNTFIA
ncbi:2-hydroxyacid dehydrogenase [Aliiglaciecola sp. LCG003]|uniref:2-hydroxyacid dehydrogenase n=1 Tax=Aliiglaciecola sp. LCG003 TaxID=3053655 RepID=UPI002573DB09|nr:2-hydroxyacid dehydrogenase [Aliiglaciecola sp. LCG003]WJG07867.1 2-hydroxyacid dehydrogenase [Aliiglaciecola sp. LCG003]